MILAKFNQKISPKIQNFGQPSPKNPGGGGGYSTLAWMGVCRPDLGTLTHV